MNDRQRKIINKIQLNINDFEPKNGALSDEERINDLEVAICELMDTLGNLK